MSADSVLRQVAERFTSYVFVPGFEVERTTYNVQRYFFPTLGLPNTSVTLWPPKPNELDIA